MKITFDIQNVEELSVLMNYAKKTGLTSFDMFMDKMIKHYSELVKKKEENEKTPEKKEDAYLINDYLNIPLKFKYAISKYGDVLCFQYGKEKMMNYSVDTSSGEIWIYLLKKGCPNKCSPAELHENSIRINLEEIYDKIFGENNFKKNAEKHILEVIDKSQQEWKNRRRIKK